MPDLPLPKVAGELLSAILDKAGDLTVSASSKVLPGALKVVAGAADKVRTVAGGAGRRHAGAAGDTDGRDTDAEHVVHMWPAGADTPARAHAAAEEKLAEAEEAGTVPYEELDAADLPVNGWDGLTVAAIRQRVRTLGSDDVTLLLAYEREHANRPAVALALERRLARLAEPPGPTDGS